MYLIWLGLRAEGWKLMRTDGRIEDIPADICLKYLQDEAKKKNLAASLATINVDT